MKETQETWVRSLGWEMTNSSSILGWKIPWTEELGELQSMESPRVEQDLQLNNNTALKHQFSEFESSSFSATQITSLVKVSL